MSGCLIIVGKTLGVIHEHLVYFVYLERGEDVVFVGNSIFVAGQGHVTL